MIKLLLVDNQDVINEDSIKFLSEQMADCCIVGEASTLQEAVEITAQKRPDILFMDGDLLLNIHQDELAQSVRHIMNQSRARIIVFLNQICDQLLVSRLISTEISALIKKDDEPHSIICAIKSILNGHRYISNSIVSQIQMADLSYFAEKAIIFPFHLLSQREFEIITQIIDGKKPKEIAIKSCLNPSTVRTHQHRILKKLNIENKSHLIQFAQDHHMLEEDRYLAAIGIKMRFLKRNLSQLIALSIAFIIMCWGILASDHFTQTIIPKIN